jgi:hypothetical protein
MNESNHSATTRSETSLKKTGTASAPPTKRRRALVLLSCFVRGVAQHLGAVTVGLLVGWWDGHR